jgi:hypothetical protein
MDRNRRRAEEKNMRFNILAGIAATALFLAYFGPIVLKLKDMPLTVVVLLGIVLVVVDLWQSLADRAG